jgi:hypothetical protein
MKRIIFPFFVIFAMALSNAQEKAVQNQISKGTTVIEFNTGLNGLGEFSIMQGSTAFQFSSFEDVSIYNFGFDGGHFIQDGLALKFGLGYGGYSFKDDYEDYDTNSFSYRLGVKYYVGDTFPFQIDLTGASLKDMDENPLWLGLQGGYAFFLGSQVSIEPGLRYSLSLNEDFTDEGVFQLNIGLSVCF